MSNENNKYNSVDNRYQYTKDALERSQKQQQDMQQQSEIDIASKYASEDIDNADRAKFADSFGDAGHAGVFKAFHHGMASGGKQATADNKDKERGDAKKARRYLEDMDRELREDLRVQKVEEMAKQKIKPYALAFLNNPYKSNEVTPAMNEQARYIADTWTKLTGENHKFQSIKPDERNIWYFEDTDTGAILQKDIRIMAGSSLLQEQELATKQASYLEEIDRKSREEDRKNKIELNKLQQDINKNSPNAKFNNKVAEGEAERLKDVAVKANETIYNASKVNKVLKDMKQIADDNPEIFGSMLVPVWTDSEQSAIKIPFQKFAMFGKDNAKTSEAIGKINKKMNELVAVGAKGLGGRANIFIEKILKAATPNTNMPKGSYHAIINDMLEENNKDIESGYSTLEDYNSKLSHTGVDQFQAGFSGQRSGNLWVAVDPTTGEEKEGSAEEVLQAMQNGAILKK